MDQRALDRARLHLGGLLNQYHGYASSEVFHRMTDDMRSMELSFSQVHVLYHLRRHGPVIIAELAKVTRLSSTAASRLVERLVKHDLVQRRENPEDRRQKYVELTDRGVSHLHEVRQSVALVYTDMFTNLPDRVVDRLSDALHEAMNFMPQDLERFKCPIGKP